MTPTITNLVPLACKASTAPTIDINPTNRIVADNQKATDDTITAKPMYSPSSMSASSLDRVSQSELQITSNYKQATEHKETEASQRSIEITTKT